MSTTMTRNIVDVPRGDRELSYDNARGKSGVAATIQRRSNMARRRQDQAEIRDALEWMDLHGDEVDALPTDGPIPELTWDELSDEWRDDDLDTIQAQAMREQAAMLPDFDVLDWYADLHEVSSPFATLTPEDLRDLTVTQMFWGDYTTDDREV